MPAFDEPPLHEFKLAPHAMPFGPGPTPDTLWDTESWLAMVEGSDPFEGPSSSVHEHEDDHPTPPTPPPTVSTIHFRVYSINPNTEKPDDIAASVEAAAPLIDLLADEGVYADEMGRGVAQELSDRALRSLDPGLLDIAEGNSFHFLKVPDAGKGNEDLTWIGVDVGEDGDFDSFLGYSDDPDALPVFVTISAEAPKETVDYGDALF